MQLGASAESGFLHHSGFLPKRTFQETKAEASGFVVAQPQRSGPLPLTSLGYTGQPRLGEGAYKGVNAKECGPLGGHLCRPAPCLSCLSLHCAPMGPACAPSSAVLSDHYPFFLFCLPAPLRTPSFHWLVILEMSVPGLVPGHKFASYP